MKVVTSLFMGLLAQLHPLGFRRPHYYISSIDHFPKSCMGFSPTKPMGNAQNDTIF